MLENYFSIPLSHIFFKAKNESSPLLIVMHGLGDQMHSYKDFPQYLLQDEIHTILFNAPEPYFMGWKWYDIDGDQQIGLNKSKQLIEESISTITQKLSISKNWIFLSGFSQGGVVSLFTGLRTKEPYAGLICLSGYLYGDREDFTEESKRTPIFMSHGLFDDLIPIQLVRQHAKKLQSLNYNILWEEYPIPHTISLEELNSLKNWLKQQIQKIKNLD